MYSCKVIIDKKEYIGDYEIIDNNLFLDIYNYVINDDSHDNKIKYRAIQIIDLRNKKFFYSPLFMAVKEYFGIQSYVGFKADFYISTSKIEKINNFNEYLVIKSIKFYHPLFNQFFNSSMLKEINEKNMITFLFTYKNSETREIKIDKNNIEKIVFGSTCGNFTYKRNEQFLNIEINNYVEIFLIKGITYDDLYKYIKELNVIVNAYFPENLPFYKTSISTVDGLEYILTNKLLGNEKSFSGPYYNFHKIDFIKFIEEMYKKISYRTIEDKNFFLPFDINNKHKSIEDEFIYYYRFIDFYIGKLSEIEGKLEPKNYKRINRFIDENLYLFDFQDKNKINELKNEIVSLRNHYLHEGYYLKNGEFEVKIKPPYMKKLDYIWLYNVTKAFKRGVFKILYCNILGFEINEKIFMLCI